MECFPPWLWTAVHGGDLFIYCIEKDPPLINGCAFALGYGLRSNQKLVASARYTAAVEKKTREELKLGIFALPRKSVFVVS